MISTSAPSALFRQAPYADATPNRCCSSINCRGAGLWKLDIASEKLHVCPQGSVCRHLARAASFALRSAPLSRPVKISRTTPALLGQRPHRPARCCRARISVGAIITPCPPDSTATSNAMKATSVLPAPTSPCNSRVHPLGPRTPYPPQSLRNRAGLCICWPVRQGLTSTLRLQFAPWRATGRSLAAPLRSRRRASARVN